MHIILTTSLRIRELQIKPMVKFHFNLKTGKSLCVAMRRERTVIKCYWVHNSVIPSKAKEMYY